jgi:hypothetical protein
MNNKNPKNPNPQSGVSRKKIVGTLGLNFPLLVGFCDRLVEPKRALH